MLLFHAVSQRHLLSPACIKSIRDNMETYVSYTHKLKKTVTIFIIKNLNQKKSYLAYFLNEIEETNTPLTFHHKRRFISERNNEAVQNLLAISFHRDTLTALRTGLHGNQRDFRSCIMNHLLLQFACILTLKSF